MSDKYPFKSLVTTRKGVVELKDLKVGDEILGFDENTQDRRFYVVGKLDYFVGKANSYYLIINNFIRFAPHQSVYANGKLIHAQTLKVGDKLSSITGEQIVVKTIRKIKAKEKKTRLEIGAKRSFFDKLFRRHEGFHNYYLNGVLVHNASRYWVGGTGNWSDNTNHWAASSGGAPGASKPTASDDANFDALSGAGTVTINEAATCLSFIESAASTITTFAGTFGLTVSANFTLGLLSTWSNTGTITFNATATGKTVTTTGTTISSPIAFDGAGGGWTLQDALNMGTKQLALTQGTLDTNGKTVTCGTFLSNNSNVRTLTLGASTVNCTSWSFTTSTNLTFNSNTSTINLSGNAFSGGGLTYNIVVISFSGTMTVTMTGANTFATLTFTGSTAPDNEFRIRANQTITGTFTIAGNSAINRIWVLTGGRYNSANFATQYTLTAATVSLSNVDFTSIIGAGAATWSGTSLGNGGNNSGITFTTPVTRYWVGNGGNWNDTAHWSTSSGGGTGASVPLIHDTVVFDSSSITSGSQSITLNIKTPALDFTNIANTPTLVDNGTHGEIFGSLKLIAAMTLSLTGWFNFISFTPITLTTAGLTLQEIDLYCPLTTFTLQDNLTLSGEMDHLFGTFDANDHNVTIYQYLFGDGYDNVSHIQMGSGTWIMGNNSNIAEWDTYPSNTDYIVGETSTLKFPNSTHSTYFYNSSLQTYNNVEFNPNDIRSYIEIQSSVNYNSLTFSKGAYVAIYNGTVQTFVTLVATGISGVPIRLNAYTGSYTLSQASGTISLDYIAIDGATATGGAVFNIGVHHDDAGNNTGFNWAMGHGGQRQALYAGSNQNIANSTTNSLMGGEDANPGWNSNGDGRKQVFAVGGRLKNLRVVLDSAPTGTGQWNFSIEKNGNSGFMPISIAVGATVGQDITTILDVLAGDQILIKCTSSGGTPSAVPAQWSIEFESTENSEFFTAHTMFSFWGNDNTKRYVPPMSGAYPQTTLAYNAVPMPLACTITSFWVNANDISNASKPYTFSIYKNGSEEASSIIQVTDTSTKNVFVTGLNIAMSAGDTLCVAVVTTGSPSANLWGGFAIGYQATTRGQSLVTSVMTGMGNTVRWGVIEGGAGGWQTTEAAAKRLGGILSFTLSKLRANLSTAPGAGTSRTFTVRKNTGAGNETVTIADANTTANDSTNSDSIVQGDVLDIQRDFSGAPSTAGYAAMALVMSTTSIDFAQFTVDGWIADRLTKTFTVDASLVQRFSPTFTVDGIVELKAGTWQFTADGYVALRTLKTFTVDAIVALRTPGVFTVDGYVALRSSNLFTVDAWIANRFTKTFTIDGIIGPIYYFLGETPLPRPNTLDRENIYIAKDVTTISGKGGRDTANLKEKITLSWNKMMATDFQVLLAQINTNAPMEFRVDDGIFEIPAMQVLATIKAAEYVTLGSDYLVSTSIELLEVE